MRPTHCMRSGFPWAFLIRLDGATLRFGFPSLVAALLSLLAVALVSAQPGAQVHRDWMQGVNAAAEETVRIARARDRFSNATDGQAMEAAWKELGGLLTNKDELYMYFAIIGDNEPEKQELFRLRGTIPILAVAGDIDGGIPEPLRGAFARAVTDTRTELMKIAREKALPLPHEVYEAKDRCKLQWAVYEFGRNRLEYQRAGKPLPPIRDPQLFVLWELQSRGDRSFAEAVRTYDAFAAAVGQETMQRTVAAVGNRPRDNRGLMTPQALAQLGLVASTEVPEDQNQIVAGRIADGRAVIWGTRPIAALRGLWTRDSQRAAAMFAMADALRLDPPMAWRRLTMIETAVGEQQFQKALAEFHAAPVRATNRMLITPVPAGDQPGKSIPFEKFKAELLAGEDTKGQVRYFIAMDLIVSDAEDHERIATDLPVVAPEGEDMNAIIDRRYQELASHKGEAELLASAEKLRAAVWQPKSIGLEASHVVPALEEMLGYKGVPNPHYLQWAGFGPGTTAIYEVEYHREPARGAINRVRKVRREIRVVAVSPDAVVLRRTDSEQKNDGSWAPQGPTTEQIPAHRKSLSPEQGALPVLTGGSLGFSRLGPEIDRQEAASIVIGDELIHCTRSIWSGAREQQQAVESRGGHPLLGRTITEIWSSSRVPGWIAKAVVASSRSVTVVRMTAFDAKPAAEALAATPASQQQSRPWMRPYDALEPSDRKPRGLDVGSRTWLEASVGSSVTHRFHYKGPGSQRSVEEELDAVVVSTLVEKDSDVALVRLVSKQGNQVIDQTEIEIVPMETHYIGNLVTWMASNRDRPYPFQLLGDVERTTVTINDQPVECLHYQHVPLKITGRQLRAERLIVSESVPGAIVYLSVRSTGGQATSLTYALQGLDEQNLPKPTKPVIKPRGGNFAVDQELMIEKNGKWERGKILRFEQLRNEAGGRYLIQVGRSPTWYEEDWLREHSRPIEETDASAPAAPSATAGNTDAPGPSDERSQQPPEETKPFEVGQTLRDERSRRTGDATIVRLFEADDGRHFLIEQDGRYSWESEEDLRGRWEITGRSDTLPQPKAPPRPVTNQWPEGTEVIVQIPAADGRGRQTVGGRGKIILFEERSSPPVWGVEYVDADEDQPVRRRLVRERDIQSLPQYEIGQQVTFTNNYRQTVTGTIREHRLRGRNYQYRIEYDRNGQPTENWIPENRVQPMTGE